MAFKVLFIQSYPQKNFSFLIWSQWLQSSATPLTRKHLWRRVIISLSRWWQGKSKLCCNILTFFLLPGIKKNTTGSACSESLPHDSAIRIFSSHFIVQGGAILAPNFTTLWTSLATVYKKHTNKQLWRTLVSTRRIYFSKN